MTSTGAAEPSSENALDRRAAQHYAAGRYADALPLAQQYAELVSRRDGADSPQYASAIWHVALLYRALGEFSEAEPLYVRALEIDEAALDPEHPAISRDLSNLALLYKNQGRYAEAEGLYQRALAIAERAQPHNALSTAIRLANLAALFAAQGRLAEAEPLLRRAAKMVTPMNAEYSAIINNLAETYRLMRAYEAAEPLYKEALRVREFQAGPNHPEVAIYLDNLGGLYSLSGRDREAEPLIKRSISISETALGPDHVLVAVRLVNLVRVYIAERRFEEAKQLMERAMAIVESTVGRENPIFVSTSDMFARLCFAQGNWPGAVDHGRASTNAIIHRMLRGGDELGRSPTGKAVNEAEQSTLQFRCLIKALYALSGGDVVETDKRGREAFEVAQWAFNSEAARSLVQMAARGVKAGGALSDIIRRRQDLVSEWQARDRTRSATAAKAPAERDERSDVKSNDRLAEIDSQITGIDERLRIDFPDYASFIQPVPLPVEDVQELLSPEEALVLILDTTEEAPLPEETFIWVITKQHCRWMHSHLGTLKLVELVRVLRCGLDHQEWATEADKKRSLELLDLNECPDDGSRPLPFNLEKSHELYSALFGQVEGLIDGKRLIIVPSGPLSSLPFQLLVKKRPATALPSTFEGYRDTAWLICDHAISVLPAVSSLKALRAHTADEGRAPLDYIGYGDPILADDDGLHRCLEASDESRPTCADNLADANSADVLPVTRGRRRTRRIAKLDQVFAKGATIDALLAQIRSLPALPDSADEIRSVGEYFRPDARLIRLGNDATKADIVDRSESGELSHYRVVHFATHALISGEIETMTLRQAEPALVLTPPDVPKNQHDNGLLLASDVARLKLNADWVVLSACNTASADRLGGEPLSGLAQAFFYARARSLLVSHWPVYSDIAVQITTACFAELDRDPDLGHAEALQRATLSLMRDSLRADNADNAHPAVWSPFIVVGEGGKVSSRYLSRRI
ncbi:CHAT domain-containing tetratricopeptide repeat protein [Bradyrhizobium elkanii]|nr:CHAT domain-containing tetratricopeptide repeat protein [Bradyrhizobium elkanii]